MASATISPLPGRLDASRLVVRRMPLEAEKAVPGPDDAVRRQQSCTTSHMLTVRWTANGGWEVPTICPYENLSLSPISSVLHYGTECFEGLKAYRGTDKALRLFRPALNCARLRKSSLRAGLPDFDPSELEKLLKAYVAVDGPCWLPDSGTFLYLRPAIIGTTEALASPGSGLKLLCSQGQVRAWPGGFGNAKLGANYAPSLSAQEDANKDGFIQVLWLFGPDDAVTEAGASNFFVLIRNKTTGRPELVTPPLGDIILDGITRRSVLELASSEGLGESLDVSERQVTMAELVAAHDENRLMEAFVSGTAFFVAPVRVIRYHDKDLTIGCEDGDVFAAPFALKIRESLRKIMYGEKESEWACVIKET